MRFFLLMLTLGMGLLMIGCRQEAPQADPPDGPNTDSPAAIRLVDVSSGTQLGEFRHENGTTGNKYFPETMSGGGGFIDINADGSPDIVAVAGGALPTSESTSVGHIAVYVNDGTGAFSSSVIQGLDNLPGYGMGVYAADLDNDGDQDLVYTTLGQNAVLLNQGDHFVASQQDLLSLRANEWSTAALIFDVDSDGWLDILIGNYVDWSLEKDLFCTTDGNLKGYCTPELYEGTSAVLYRNKQDGTFEEATTGSGFEAMTGKTLGMAMLDFNSDGLPDVVVANDTDPDQLFVNQGGGRFVETGVASGLAFDERGRARAGMGIDAGITDGTGRSSVFVGNFSDEMLGVYRHLRGTSFIDRAAGSGIGQPSILTLAFGLKLTDVDLDGFLDVFVANGHVEQTVESVRDNVFFKQRPHLFMSDGQGSFVDSAEDAGFATYAGRSAATGDMDGDGDEDLLLFENNGPLHLWRNDSAGRGVTIAVENVGENRNGIGSTIELWVSGRRQERMIRTGGSYLSASSLTASFGLGNAQKADSVVVRWPDGYVQTVTYLDPGRHVIRRTVQD
ncbi:MAG: CRTAC1 family protein [Bacteroidetes bacterium]|nr:CRTAC1 family protein [Bacteroidota bacterium]